MIKRKIAAASGHWAAQRLASGSGWPAGFRFTLHRVGGARALMTWPMSGGRSALGSDLLEWGSGGAEQSAAAPNDQAMADVAEMSAPATHLDRAAGRPPRTDGLGKLYSSVYMIG